MHDHRIVHRLPGDDRFPSRHRIRQCLILPGLMAALAGLCPTMAQGWGSTEAPVFVNTHQFIEEKAYNALTNDSSFYPGALPALASLREWAGNYIWTNGVFGNGPDVTANSYFWDHWYNPRNQEGRGPEAVQENALAAVRSGRSDAKMVDWGAHYMADMSTPVHVNGVGLETVQAILAEANRKADNEPVHLEANITGYSDDPLRDWRPEIERFLKANKEEPRINFFDPWYWDYYGVDLTHLSGTHQKWETWWHAPYSSSFDAVPPTGVWALLNRSPVASKSSADWKNGPPSFDNYAHIYAFQAHEFAIKAAAVVAARNEKIQAGEQTKPMAQLAMETSITNVYTLWRGSFSALHPSLQMELTNGYGNVEFKITGLVTNWVAEEVTLVRCRLSFVHLGVTNVLSDEKDIRRIAKIAGHGEAKAGAQWVVVIPDAGDEPVFKVEVIGAYAHTPDLQYAYYETAPPSWGFWRPQRFQNFDGLIPQPSVEHPYVFDD